MSDLEKQERLLDLLADRALFALSPEEEREIESLLEIFPEYRNDDTFALSAAAIDLAGLDTIEEMPASLRASILANADEHFGVEEKENAPHLRLVPDAPDFQPSRGFNWNWLGWAFAAVAVVALVGNIWINRAPQQQIVDVPPVEQPKATMAEMRQRMMDSSPDITKAVWGAGNMTDLKEVGGDVVWSDSRQEGYMRFTGLPANDGTKETYQLWIFDETQDPKTPIDGGVFNVNANGEAIIPINAKLKAKNPSAFAITVEKPGGVVVSDRKKIAALAKTAT